MADTAAAPPSRAALRALAEDVIDRRAAPQPALFYDEDLATETQ